MKLFVDDIRECPAGWILARTVTEAIRILSKGEVRAVSLDFDIRTCSNKRCKGRVETFEPVCLYIRTMRHYRPELILIHTGNVEEGRRMATLLEIPYNNEIFNEENYR